jgi:hypothetical protein
MEKLVEASSAMAKLELQMTKDVDAIRHKLISSQQSERDEMAGASNAALHNSSASSCIVPPRVAALRDVRLRGAANATMNGGGGSNTLAMSGSGVAPSTGGGGGLHHHHHHHGSSSRGGMPSSMSTAAPTVGRSSTMFAESDDVGGASFVISRNDTEDF